MSAIAGIFYPAAPKPVDPARIRAMTDVQAHRGPDGAGVWTGRGVGLGHRRSAIVAGSVQPLVDVEDEIAVTCDGTIANYRDVRAELVARGARFRTAGDVEVLVHGWRHWGPAMLDRLAGGFAFAIHDARTQTLFLARDRLGAKPLHHAELSDGALAFASELKGVLVHPMLRRVPDVRAVEDYLALGYVPDDACLVAGVRKLAAGHFLLVERGRAGAQARARQYWDVDFSVRASGAAAALADELAERMREGVRSALVADAEVGALLSDGMGSASMVALMAEASPRAVSTVTAGSAMVVAQAETIAHRFATDHRSRESDVVGDGSGDGPAFDEPFADGSVSALSTACGLARERVTVAMTGAGAGEVLAGHGRYRARMAQDRIRALLPARVRRVAFERLAALRPPLGGWRRGLRALAGDGDLGYADAVAVMPRDVRAALLSDAARRALAGHRAEDRYVAAMRDAPARDALARMQYADIKIGLAGDALMRADRVGMAWGLELRAAMLDHRLVEFCASLPGAYLVRGGEGQWLMKQAMAPYLPREILYRRAGVKDVADAGIPEWGTTLRMLTQTGWFDMAAVDRLAAADRTGRTTRQLSRLARCLRALFG